MTKRILLFNSQKELLGKIGLENGRFTADINMERFGDGYEEFRTFLAEQGNTRLFMRKPERVGGIILSKKIAAQGDDEKAIAFSEAISRSKFSFGRIFAVVGVNENLGGKQ